MGKTSVPLTLWVYLAWIDHPAIAALRAQGHTIRPIDISDADIILHPSACAWVDEMFDHNYLAVALKGARARKRTKEAA